MKGMLRRLVVVVASCTAFGCATPSATERFYALSDGATASPVAGVAATGAPLTVVVGAVTVPQLVDRPQIVTQDGASRVSVSEQNQWAEPLTAAIGRTLAARLARTLTDGGRPARVAAYPQNSIIAPDVRVTVDVQRFDAVLGGEARIDALWTVRRTGSGNVVSGRTSATRTADDGSYDAVVRAWSEALARVDADVAAAIVSDRR